MFIDDIHVAGMSKLNWSIGQIALQFNCQEIYNNTQDESNVQVLTYRQFRRIILKRPKRNVTTTYLAIALSLNFLANTIGACADGLLHLVVAQRARHDQDAPD